MCGIFEYDDDQIVFQSGMNPEGMKKAKKELEDTKRVLFKDNWIKIVNAEKHNAYRKSPSNLRNYQSELNEVPKHIMKYFDSVIGASHEELTKEKTEVNTIDYLKDFNDESLEYHKKKFPQLSEATIKDQVGRQIDWLAKKGEKYEDYQAGFNSWLANYIDFCKRDKVPLNEEKKISERPAMSPEVLKHAQPKK